MGNSTTDATCQTTVMTDSQDSFQSNTLSIQNISSLFEIMTECNKGSPAFRFSVLILILLMALPANASLLWMMLRNRRTLSPSELLGLNLALLSVLFCLNLPLYIYTSMGQPSVLSRVSSTFLILIYFSCPLLLTGMCAERYMAVSHPVLFLRMGGWEYRAVSSALIWTLTCSMFVVAYMYSIQAMALALSLILNLLFFLMLACLLSIMCVLRKKGPGEGRTGELSDSSIKKRALKVIIAVLVPSTVIYMPLLCLAPLLLVVQAAPHRVSRTLICGGLQLLSVLPGFGVCIGPMFYMSRIRQMLCYRNNKALDLREARTNNPRSYNSAQTS